MAGIKTSHSCQESERKMNPYLPLYEYIPDGEPRIFGNRVYIYGSHDKSHGTDFCLNNYVCWSADCSNLEQWKYEGEIYRREDDPDNREGRYPLFAPDCVQGEDGRYYLYYAPGGIKNCNEWYIAVAVCDTPAGKFQYYGRIDLMRWADKYFAFDPGVLVDEGRIYLYYGFGMNDSIPGEKGCGGAVVELEPDMITVKSEPVSTVPNLYHDSDKHFKNHAFFEASSIRKIKDKYYFIYSSEKMHELCYAVSESPMGKFEYGGILISNADIGYQGNQISKNWYGNNHGSLACINGEYYIFYHRHTQSTSYSRQGCCEKIALEENGMFLQAECTSQGMCGCSLPASGSYSATIAANLFNSFGSTFNNDCLLRGGACFYEDGEEVTAEQYVKNFTATAKAVYKYFAFNGRTKIKFTVRGYAKGSLCIETEHDRTQIKIHFQTTDWKQISGEVYQQGESMLSVTFDGTGYLDIKELTFCGGKSNDENSGGR